MRIYKSEEKCTVADAPCGLFLLEDSDELICISEYRMDGSTRKMAIIVSSGEYYHGEGDSAFGWPLVIT